MTLAKSGANQLIGQFGVYVKVYPQDSQSPDNPDDPVFFSETDNTSTFEEHKVRLYSSASDEMMSDYGFDSSADAMMYSTEDIASEGDTVEYEKGGYKWNVEAENTNQISEEGPYIFVYSMGAL